MKKIINVILGILLLVFATTQMGWAEEYFPPPRHQQGIIGGYGGQEWRLGQFTGLILNGVTYVLPAADGGANEVLETDGSGTLSWVANAAGAAWDDLTVPDNDESLDMTTHVTVWDFGGVADMFTLEFTGDFADVSGMVLHQKTGNPTDGTVLEVIAADDNVDPLVISASNKANALVVGQNTGVVTVAGVAEATSALIITAGDLLLTDGDIHVDAGDCLFDEDVTVGGNLDVTGAIYLSDVVPSAGGLTLNAAGVSIIDIGNVSTGVINITGGGVNIGDGATDTLTITGIIDSDVTLDDGVTDSPKMIFKDSDDEQAEIYQDQSSDDLNVEPHSAADSLAITVGNLSVGTPASGVIGWDGGDFYVADDAEIDGTLVVDTDLDVNGTANISGALVLGSTVSVAGISSFSENIVLTAAADEYLQIDADTTPNTTTAGVLDIDFETATNSGKAVAIAIELEDGATLAYGIYADVDDDTTGAEVIHLYSAANAAGTNATTKGFYAANTIDDCFEAVLAAAGQGLVIDGTTTANTNTGGGLMDLAFRTATTTAQAINIDVESDLAGGAAETVVGIHLQLDDDANTATDILTGIEIDTDADGTGLQHAIIVKDSAGWDAGLWLEGGYLRVGTGGTPDQTLSDGDNAYLEGFIEVDGNIYADGNITGDGATEMVGVRHDVVDPGAVANYAVTAAMSGTVFINSQATEFDLPADPTGLEFTFIVHNATNLDIDPNVNDRFPSPITNANGDYIRSSTIGDSVTIVGINATTWYIKAIYPASTDWVEE